ncbi:MAG: hypothetical protein ABJB03_08750 [Rhodoglobus sp.]
MTRRIVALVSALVASLLGHLALWGGGGVLAQEAAQYARRGPNVVAVLVLVLGLLLIAAAIATVAISAAGVIALGIIHIVVSLLTVLSPADASGGSVSPIFGIFAFVYRTSQSVSDGLYLYFPTGFGLLTGVIFLVVGLAALARTGASSTQARVVSVVVAVVVGFFALAAAVSGGFRLYASQLQLLSGLDALGLVLLIAATIALAIAVLTVRWSSAGVLVLGAATIVLTIALFGLFTTSTLPGFVMSVSRELGQGLANALPDGNLALVGVLLVVGGLAVRWRALRRPRATDPAPVADADVTPAASV